MALMARGTGAILSSVAAITRAGFRCEEIDFSNDSIKSSAAADVLGDGQEKTF